MIETKTAGNCFNDISIHPLLCGDYVVHNGNNKNPTLLISVEYIFWGKISIHLELHLLKISAHYDPLLHAELVG